MEETTTVTAPTVEGAPGAAPDTTPTTPAATGGDTRAEARITGLTAERDRLKEKLEAQEARLREIEEQNKSDEQKRVEERAQELHGADLQRLRDIDDAHQRELDGLLERIPEERRGLVTASAPLHERLSQARNVLALLQEKTIPAPIDSGGTPVAAADKPIMSRAEFDRIASLAGALPGTPEREEYDKKWPTYKQAYYDGRIK